MRRGNGFSRVIIPNEINTDQARLMIKPTNNIFFARKVKQSIASILKKLPRASIASKSWKNNGK